MTIAVHRPQFNTDEAGRLAQELYDIQSVSIEALPSERDQNFHLVGAAGPGYVLKISSATEDEAVLDLQNKVLVHLSNQTEMTVCPQVVPTRSGQAMTRVAGPNGSSHFVRLLTYLPGVPLGRANPHTPELLANLGQLFGTIDKTLQEFSHPAAHRELKWDMKRAGAVIRDHLACVTDSSRRTVVAHFLAHFEQTVAPRLTDLRTSMIHNDGNDYNVLVEDVRGTPDLTALRPRKVVGVIDFGDMLHSYTVSEVAIVCAYAGLNKMDPLAAAAQVVKGYHQVFPLTEAELAVLFSLICIRLCTSVTMAAFQQQLEPDNEYLKISERPAWSTLEKLRSIDPQLAHYAFRQACGLTPCPQEVAIVGWLKENRAGIGRIVQTSLKPDHCLVFDLSVGSLLLGDPADWRDPTAFAGLLFGTMQEAGAIVGLGRYGEARQIYTSELFSSANGEETDERRTIHLGIDLFLQPGSPVFAPLVGTVHSFADNTAHLDYGPTVVLEHQYEAGRIKFFTLYGHLSKTSLEGLTVGMPVALGQRLGTIGDYPDNGGWPPHLHFQIILDMLGRVGEFPGVAFHSMREVWLGLCPDPNLILGLPAKIFPARASSQTELLDRRRQHLGKSLSLSYNEPLKIVRGFRQYLYDDTGRAYLDAVNNVPHVGHCHPRVVQAGQAQMAVLNTNTRYLHDNLVDYAERLCATLPDPLSVCFFVCSGSEANDLALRMARTHTGHHDVLVVDGAYHGNLSSLVEISPYKFDGPGGFEAPPHAHKVIMPDPYRGPYKADDPQAGVRYARHLHGTIEAVQGRERRVAAFFCESLLGCGGQIVLPENYLKMAYGHVREAGGVCIADEVQVGFGRVGSHFWGFALQEVVPDIVTLGKPIGNGHPLAAVVTTPQIADSFANGMEYFNTFGGNPVSCAIGLAVLDVIEAEKLQENALQVGRRLKGGLKRLMSKYPLIGDVRGEGLFIGIELVLNRETLAPAGSHASYIANRMKAHGVLISTDGPLHNVLKIKPPLVFSEDNADLLVRTLEKILADDVLQV